MSMARTAARRRKQLKMGMTHLARLSPYSGRSRPQYPGTSQLSVHDAIAREKQKAAKQASIKKKAA